MNAEGGIVTVNMNEGSRVVARFKDGRVLKGTTHDFAPHKPSFHLCPSGRASAKPVEILIESLKAVFFVKHYEGDSARADDNSFDGAQGQGRRVVVTFADDEVVAGFTVGYTPGKPGFFVIPADTQANNNRVFVVNSSVRKIEWLRGAAPATAARGR